MTQRTTQKETTTMSNANKAAQAELTKRAWAIARELAQQASDGELKTPKAYFGEAMKQAKTRALDMTAPEAKPTKPTKAKKVVVGRKLTVTADMQGDDIKKVMRKVSVAKTLGDCRKDGFAAKTEAGKLSLHKSEVKKGEWAVKLDGKVAVESTRYFKARRFIKAVMFGIVKVGSKEAAAILK